MAHISGDAELRELFHIQGDVYILLASRIFEKHQHEISKQEREQAKVICLGLEYFMLVYIFNVISHRSYLRHGG